MNLFEMTVPEIPKKEFLMHNRVDLLNDEQKIWWDALVRLSDVLSLTMQNHIERTTGSYLSMLFTEFLDGLYTVTHTPRRCGREFIFDDFINIASFSVSALKHIVSSPSTQIVKNTEKVHVSALHQTSSKTMQWMARRPGRSVQEKIAPQNKVMTNVTHFSTDTKENREALYLYNVLHDIVRDRIKDTNCLQCQFAEVCGVPTKDIRDLLGLHAKIRHGDLSDVRPEKQSMQNNKLMCDVNYKMVWDGVKQLSRIEDGLKENWQNLQQRYLQLGFWSVLAEILHDTDTAILDSYGTVTDSHGILAFCDSNGLPIKNSLMIYPSVRPWEPILLELNGSELSLYEGDPFFETLYFNLASIELFDGEIIEAPVTSAVDKFRMSDTPSPLSYEIADQDNYSETVEIEHSEPVIEKMIKPEGNEDPKLLDEPFLQPNDINSDILLSIGDTIKFGSYWQSTTKNNRMPIEWKIIDIKDDYAMLISQQSLDCRLMNLSSKVSDWPHTDLCTWLNTEFIVDAFSEKERLSIKPVPYDESHFVTLLSQEEAEKLFNEKSDRICHPTEYAISKGSTCNHGGFAPYWTRSILNEYSSAIAISGSGNFRKLKYQTNFIAVRPVIFLRLFSQ